MLESMMLMEWSWIEKYLGDIKSVKGGFTKAIRGIVKLPERRVFVKIGVDETTSNWIQREIEVYRILQNHKYTHSPKLLSIKEDQTAFAIEAKEESKGWDWSNNWNTERLFKTFEAMDDLANIILESTEKDFFNSENGLENENGWKTLANNVDLQKLILEKVGMLSIDKIISMSQLNTEFIFDKTTLVHNDVRSDNCAWNQLTQKITLVDWNWTQLGDRRIDVNAVLVDVALSGIDVFNIKKNRLDKNALVWLAGFWFKSAATKLSTTINLGSLIDFQIKSGITALELSMKM